MVLWPANGLPLFYFDTGDYLLRGEKLLSLLIPATPSTEPVVTPSASIATGGTEKEVIQGDRSAVYSLFLAILTSLFGLGSVVIAQATALLIAVLMPMRAAFRTGWIRLSPTTATSFAILAACLGSAPFYTTYLMPDIFAPILILLVATACAFGERMTRLEQMIALVSVVFALTAHPSHLIIGAVLVPVAGLFFLLRTRTSKAPVVALVLGGILAVGIAERVLFRVAVENLSKAEVSYLPFLTVRLISDGPGLDYLRETCPSNTRATCALYDKVKVLPQPLEPDIMMFNRTPGEGSFQLLDAKTKSDISKEQLMFVRDVVISSPLGVIQGAMRNTIEQLGLTSVVMTLPLDVSLKRLPDVSENPPDALRLRQILDHSPWLNTLNSAHNLVYVVSLTLILGLIAWPGVNIPNQVRLFVGIVLIGIVVNALVCGAIAQPAERYGGRVIFLLPMMLAVLITALPYWRRNRSSSSH